MKVNLYNTWCKSRKLARITMVSVALFAIAGNASAQHKKLNVLFIGNSFTETNKLPLVFRDAATSAGDTAIVDWNSPDAYTLQQHSTDAVTLSKIALAKWNYVVLQEQSQMPAFPDADVAADVYPYAKALTDSVTAKNKCGRVAFFETWGYKNGDAGNCPTFPPVCTFEGMDSLLEKRYDIMAVDNKALLSPVGLVFKELKKAMPALNLYATDNIHPSEAGTYAAAITFYTILFGKDPTLIPFIYSLPPTDADFIRRTVQNTVYTSLAKFYVGKYNPKAAFTPSVSGKVVTFNSSSSFYISNYNWDFGDGGTSTLANPTHTYATNGTYTVRLIGDNCLVYDTVKLPVVITSSGAVKESSVFTGIEIFPNPARTVLNITANANLHNASLSITNIMGAQMLQQKFDGKAINIENLSAGIYLIYIKDELSGESITRKFVKE